MRGIAMAILTVGYYALLQRSAAKDDDVLHGIGMSFFVVTLIVIAGGW